MASEKLGKALALLQALSSGDEDGAIRHVSLNRLAQHDPSRADGVTGLRERTSRRVEHGDHLDVVRVLQDMPLVVEELRSNAWSYSATTSA